MVRQYADVAGEIAQAGLPPATLFLRNQQLKLFLCCAAAETISCRVLPTAM
jgi:hypothetical protein